MGMKATGQHRLFAACDAMRHEHGFGCAGRAIIHGGIGHIHAGEQSNLRLEFKKILQRALRDFRLIGRVAGQKL